MTSKLAGVNLTKKQLADLSDAVHNVEMLVGNLAIQLREARGFCSPKEAEARAKIIMQIIRAKREAGFTPRANFFDDVWPVALEALRESRQATRTTKRARSK